MQIHPLADQSGLTRLERARQQHSGCQFDRRNVVAIPGMDMGHAVVADVHVDHDAVGGAETSRDEARATPRVRKREMVFLDWGLDRHFERFASPGPDGLVFPNPAGNPLAAASFWNNHCDGK